jgi:hypothetical protein
LVEYGSTPEKVEIYSQNDACIDRDIFFDWLKDALVPDLQRRRIAFHYWGPAFLLLDGCSPHFSEGVTKFSDESNLKLLYIPPHSSHLLQCLDVCVFGIAKRRIPKINRTEEVNSQISHIIQLMNGFLSAALPMNLIEPFRNVGISLNRVGLQIRCAVTPNNVRLWEKEGNTEKNAVGEEKNGPEDEQASLDFEGYVMNCVALSSSGEEAEDQEEEGEE